MRTLFVATALVCSFQLSAQEQTPDTDGYFPQQITAKELKILCAASALTSTGRERRRYCSGFVSGVEEGVRLLERQQTGSTRPSLCIPPGTTSRAFGNAYIKYVSRRDVNLDRPAALVVLEALQATFPCPGAATGK